jgi:protein ImuB
MFGVVYDALPAKAQVDTVLEDVARAFSPRIETYGAREVVLDLRGLTRLFGDARALAGDLRRAAADRGRHVRVAVAGTRTAARLLVRHRAGLTVVESGTEAEALAPLPVALLAGLVVASAATDADDARSRNAGTRTYTLRRWGVRTLGALASLPPDAVAARLGQDGVLWQCLARGEDLAPLVPAVPGERFEQSLDLEWPIEDLEPLSFVLGRLLDPLAAHLERRDRGAAVLHTRLQLVRTGGEARQVHERSLQLPVPMRDARTLRTLVLLDLESHPPPAAVDRVTVAVDPTPARVVQYSLLTRPLPSPEQLFTLLARLQALVGETRCGSAMPVDSWRPGAFTMRPFAPALDDHPSAARPGPVPEARPETGAMAVALRRYRLPVPVRVHETQGRPASVTTIRRGITGGDVTACAGPWRTSGGWWTEASDEARPWDRDEWDVTLAVGVTYRLFRERATNQWFLDGIVD